jgi:hypothetical protein
MKKKYFYKTMQLHEVISLEEVNPKLDNWILFSVTNSTPDEYLCE